MRKRYCSGVVSGEKYLELLRHCKAQDMALPAINVSNGCMLNSVLEGAAAANSDIIIQISAAGAHFYAGSSLQDKLSASILGARLMAEHVHLLARHYGVCVALHTDHADQGLLPWVDGLINYGETYYRKHGYPLFSSHMIDLSAEPLDVNIRACKSRLERMAKIGMSLEFEVGNTGGEEDGVGRRFSRQKRSDLYADPHQVLRAYESLSRLGHVTVAVGFGNVHGVYKPGNVILRPELLEKIQVLVSEEKGLPKKPLDLVFHGGSGSSIEDFQKAIQYGVVKINVDTDTQFAFAQGAGKHIADSQYAFETQYDEMTGKVFKQEYDPRSWLRCAEISMAGKVAALCHQFGSAGKTLARYS